MSVRLMSMSIVEKRPSMSPTFPIRSRPGLLRAGEIFGDLYDLATGRAPPRRSATEITLFKNAGGAHLDLMTAELVFSLIHEITVNEAIVCS